MQENTDKELLIKLFELVEFSKKSIVSQANSTLTLLFWQIGNRLNDFVLNNKRTKYGKQIMSTVSTNLNQ